MEHSNIIKPDRDENGKWGYVYNYFHQIIPFIYSAAMPAHDNICWVRYLNWGAIDFDGTVVIPFIYQNVFRIAPQVYRVLALNGKYGLLDHRGNIILDTAYDSIFKELCTEDILVVRSNGKVEYVNLQGEKLFEDLNVKSLIPFNSCVQVSSDSGEYIYFNKDKRISVPNNLFISDGNEKFVVLSEYLDEKEYFYIYDTEGQLVFQYTDTKQYYFYNGHIINNVSIIKNSQGLKLHNLDTHQEIVLEQFCDFQILDDQYIMAITDEKKFGVINIDGNVVIPSVYAGLGTSFCNEKIYGDYYNGRFLAASMDGETCGIIDFEQNIIVPFEYSSIKAVEEDKDLLIVRKNGKYGVVTIDNHIIINLEYDSISQFYNDVAIARKNNKAGAIDSRGNIVIPFRYDHIEDFQENDYTVAREDNSFTFYDINGNITFEGKDVKIDALINGFLKVSKEVNSFFYGKSIKLTGYVDMFGLEIIPCDLLVENHKYFKCLYEQFNTVPVWNFGSSVEVDIDAIKDKYQYVSVGEIEKDSFEKISESFSSGNLLVEYAGYYIYSIAAGNNPMGCRDVSCVVNPQKQIILTSLKSTLSFVNEDENFIYLKYDDPDSWYQRIIIDKQTQDLRQVVLPADSKMLSVIEKNYQYGVWHNQMGLVTAIAYDKIQILRNIVLAIKDNNLCVLLDGYLPLKEMQIEKSDSYKYGLKAISPDFVGLYYDDCVMFIFEKDNKYFFCRNYENSGYLE